MKQIIVFVLLTFVLFTFASLIAAAPYLLWLLPGGMPLGNVLTAAGLCAAAGVAYLLGNTTTLIRWAAIIAIILAFLWLPVSVGLAGNLSLNFDGNNGVYWIYFSLATLAIVLLAMFCAIAKSIVDKSFKSRR